MLCIIFGVKGGSFLEPSQVSQAQITEQAENFLAEESKNKSEAEKKEKLHQAARELVTERLEKFLTDGDKLEGCGDIDDFDLPEARFGEFLDYMERSGSRRWVCIKLEKDPRDSRYKRNKDGLIRNVIQYCVDNLVFIWNNGRIEQYDQE